MQKPKEWNTAELSDEMLEPVTGGFCIRIPEGHHVFRCSRCGRKIEIASHWTDHYSIAETMPFPCTLTPNCTGKMRWSCWHKDWVEMDCAPGETEWDQDWTASG